MTTRTDAVRPPLPAEYASDGERDRLALCGKYACRALGLPYGVSPREVEEAIDAQCYKPAASPDATPARFTSDDFYELGRITGHAEARGERAAEIAAEVDAILATPAAKPEAPKVETCDRCGCGLSPGERQFARCFECIERIAALPLAKPDAPGGVCPFGCATQEEHDAHNTPPPSPQETARCPHRALPVVGCADCALAARDAELAKVRDIAATLEKERDEYRDACVHKNGRIAELKARATEAEREAKAELGTAVWRDGYNRGLAVANAEIARLRAERDELREGVRLSREATRDEELTGIGVYRRIAGREMDARDAAEKERDFYKACAGWLPLSVREGITSPEEWVKRGEAFVRGLQDQLAAERRDRLHESNIIGGSLDEFALSNQPKGTTLATAVRDAVGTLRLRLAEARTSLAAERRRVEEIEKGCADIMEDAQTLSKHAPVELQPMILGIYYRAQNASGASDLRRSTPAGEARREVAGE